MKQITILGGTGTIGDNMLDLLDQHKGDYHLYGVSAFDNMEKLSAIIAKYKPQYVAVPKPEKANQVKTLCDEYKVELLVGDEAICALASHKVDLVVGAIVGMAGLASVVAAVKAGQKIALANKESLVAAGHLIMPMLGQYGADIIPVDSEHNAIHQCLMGHKRDDVRMITLTASGGPFLHKSLAELAHVGRADALAHPNWVMGAKVTIDSASLMNKGLELIEAAHLFSAGAHELDAIIHPQSIIHGMVDFKDSSLIAHMATADMRLPLGFALGLGDRLTTNVKALDLVSLGQLDFYAIDEDKFRCFALARQVIDEAPEKAVILNAANEVAVAAFLDEKIDFLSISKLVETALSSQIEGCADDLDSIFDLDNQTRSITADLISSLG